MISNLKTCGKHAESEMPINISCRLDDLWTALHLIYWITFGAGSYCNTVMLEMAKAYFTKL